MMVLSPEEDRQFRLRRLRNIMAEMHANWFVLYGNTWVVDNTKDLFYVTDLNLVHLIPTEIEAVALIPLDGEPMLAMTESIGEYANESWIKDIRVAKDLVSEIKSRIGQSSPNNMIAVAGESIMSHRTLTSLNSAFAKEHRISGAQAMEKCRFVKSDREVSLIEKAQQISDAGSRVIIENAKPGVREFELVAEAYYAMRNEGCTGGFILLASGKKNTGMAPAGGRRLEDGDVVIWETDPSYKGYMTELCRTLVVGKPRPEFEKCFRVVEKALADTTPVLRAGSPIASIAQAHKKAATEAGYGDYYKPPFIRAGGHAIGVTEGANWGSFMLDSPGNLEPNYTLVIHPNQSFPETGYLALGDPFVVTKDGPKKLTRIETKLFAK